MNGVNGSDPATVGAAPRGWTNVFRRVLTFFMIFLFSAFFMLFLIQCTQKTSDKKFAAEKKSAHTQKIIGSSKSKTPEQNIAEPKTIKMGVAPKLSEKAAVAGSAQPASKPMSPLTGDGRTASIPTLPRKTREEFVKFMMQKPGEDEKYLNQRYNRAMGLIRNKDISADKEITAFLLTPREKFCRKHNLKRAYDSAFLDIGYGVTISGPYLVGRMTDAIDVKPGDKVLEIGTGSGYQSALLSYMTDNVYTIEIIEPLSKETSALYSSYAKAGYPEYGKIKTMAADGYYGWKEYAPFDKIIVTCGIDHIPPDLLKQLKLGGVMVIPVGPPSAQIVLKVTKQKDSDGNIVITREDIYHGREKVPFVPFTKTGGGTHFLK